MLQQKTSTRQPRALRLLRYSAGHALVPLLIFITVGMLIVMMSIALVIMDSTIISSFQQSNSAKYLAESGAENAIMNLLRNPNYVGETLTIGSGTVTTVVTGSNPFIITATGRSNGFSKTLEVQVTPDAGLLTVTSWQELP